MEANKVVVTGAFGYSGKYIADRLIKKGYQVVTLTNSPFRNQQKSEKILIHPYDFEHPKNMELAFNGVKVLFNTYWIRMESSNITFTQVVQNTKKLIEVACNAGVTQIIHISVSNPSLQSRSKYYRSKAEVEEIIKSSGLQYTILRPAFLFGNEDILINNIAWMLRKLPAYPIFGNGTYKVRPIHVEDLADLAVEQINQNGNKIINAGGQVTYQYRDFITAIENAICINRPLIPVPIGIGYYGSVLLGLMLKDVITTREELDALVSGNLNVDGPAIGNINLNEWLKENSSTLGKHYRSERKRRQILTKPYQEL